ncbi:hypothetical protein LTR09_002147 [Extremus antarcticus]|uniref:Uncharacterized protein n=1 Tax=Extremus antarcticus TaxID=702011 RepID=A0AAJ0GGK3_9PEZI|nr:hypothetical protein LTR09_002147 [Extremus antarcticus]
MRNGGPQRGYRPNPYGPPHLTMMSPPMDMYDCGPYSMSITIPPHMPPRMRGMGMGMGRPMGRPPPPWMRDPRNTADMSFGGGFGGGMSPHPPYRGSMRGPPPFGMGMRAPPPWEMDCYDTEPMRPMGPRFPRYPRRSSSRDYGFDDDDEYDEWHEGDRESDPLIRELHRSARRHQDRPSSWGSRRSRREW